MKSHKSASFFLASVVLLFASTTAEYSILAADLIPSPVKPSELLALLPQADANWKLTISSGANVRQNPPLSRIVREYTKTAPLVPLPDGTLPEPEKLQIIVSDTCEIEIYKEAFASASAETGGSDQPTKLTLNGFPAFQFKTPEGNEKIQTLVNGRFLISFVFIGPSREKVENWMDRMNIGGFAQLASNSKKIDLDNNFDFWVERVDELNPKRSRTSVMTFAGNAAVEE